MERGKNKRKGADSKNNEQQSKSKRARNTLSIASGDEDQAGLRVEQLPLSRANIEVLGATHWNLAVNSVIGKKNIIKRTSDLSTLKPAKSIQFAETVHCSQNPSGNLWCRVIGDNKKFVAVLVLFGLTWRVEAEVASIDSKMKDSSKVQDLILNQVQVFREVEPVAGQAIVNWIKSAPTNLGFLVGKTVRCITALKS